MRLAQRLDRVQRRSAVTAKSRALASPQSAAPDPGPLLDFVPRVSPEFFRPDHLTLLANGVEEGFLCPGKLRLCFSVAVRHGKTQFLHHVVAWILAKNPRAKILYCTYGHTFSEKQTARIRVLAKRAGVQLGGARKKAYWETAAGGFVMAAGLGSPITGHGFNWVIIDDPHKSRLEAESKNIRDRVADAFYADIFNRLEPGGTNFLVVHARWHVNDLIGTIMARKGTAFRYENLKAIGDDGQPLCPRLYSLETLDEQKQEAGPYNWASLFQGEPRPRGGTMFGDATLYPLRRDGRFRYAIGIDLAHTASTQSDHNAAVVMRRDLDAPSKEPILDVVEAYRARGSLTDREIQAVSETGDIERMVVDEGFVTKAAALYAKYDGATFVMYAQKAELPTVSLYEKAIQKKLGTGKSLRIVVIEAAREKMMRAMPYAVAWEEGRVRLPGRLRIEDGHTPAEARLEIDGGWDRNGWASAFATEHVNFQGKTEENDQVDAAAAAHDYLCKPVGKRGGRTSGHGSEAERLANVM